MARKADIYRAARRNQWRKVLQLTGTTWKSWRDWPAFNKELVEFQAARDGVRIVGPVVGQTANLYDGDNHERHVFSS